MTTYKTHIAGDRDIARTKCGLSVRQITKHGEKHLPLASMPEQITCRNCLTLFYFPEKLERFK